MKALFIVLLVVYLIIVTSVSIFDFISRYRHKDGIKDTGDKYLINIDYSKDNRK